MLISLADIGALDRFDHCVIGTGPAGLTTAMALAESGARVLLLEGGEMDPTDRSQELYQAEVIGDSYFDLEYARLRFFGGTSGHWSGWCRALDAADFTGAAAVPETGWPIVKADLDPYLARASDMLEIPPIPADIPLPESNFHEIFFEFSPPVRFGEKYADAVGASRNLFLALDANVIRLNAEGDAVTSVTVQPSDGPAQEVRANTYILCAGGIETSRILLWSNEMSGGAVVRNHAALGRYWMEHPHFDMGAAFVESAFLPHTRYFTLAPAAREALGALSCALRVETSGIGRTKGLIRDIACIAPDLATWAGRQLDRNAACGVLLAAAWEQAPRAENRVALAPGTRDRFGMPRAALHWRKSQQDLKTARDSAIAFGAYLAEAGIGRLKLADWLLGEGDYPEDDELAGYHHMGGARMADGPAMGVVDRNCKVHGQPNLYVMGSSVFPSCGHANPTLTIVQLALRLAEHLAK